MAIRFYSAALYDHNIEFSGDKMDNGETRIRLISDTSTYIRTETKDQVGWQNSHYHSEQTEFYLVERGEVLLAVICNGETVIKKYHRGDSFKVDPMVHHNIKMTANGLLHTVKYGGKPDWNASPELDLCLRNELL